MTKEEGFCILVLIEYSYPHFTMRNELVSYFFEVCEKLNYHAFLKNIKRHIRSQAYPPSMHSIMEEQLSEDFIHMNNNPHDMESRMNEMTSRREYKNEWMKEYSLLDKN
ncbi:hypothetical protein LS684_11650 [Cytobacillus spongiae]|uniref:hypothetical protein n=1 Tax=Cytobacillus spongiae TaxID=2901381 RepID=UPI001F31484D|nr:hypothetical protein [Cytobacillus spongiae]UII54340.1 hypothetical protein LS684_11650 [Cytobacillus spongiae]